MAPATAADRPPTASAIIKVKKPLPIDSERSDATLPPIYAPIHINPA